MDDYNNIVTKLLLMSKGVRKITLKNTGSFLEKKQRYLIQELKSTSQMVM